MDYVDRHGAGMMDANAIVTAPGGPTITITVDEPEEEPQTLDVQNHLGDEG